MGENIGMSPDIRENTWREVTIIPSRHISNAKYIRKKKMIVLELPIMSKDGKFEVLPLYVKGRAVNQFLSKLGITKMNLILQKTYSKTQEVLNTAIMNTDSKIVLAISPQNTVYRVTTEAYIPIPHRLLFDYVANVINEYTHIEYKKIEKWDRSTVCIYRLPKLDTKSLGVYLGVRNANTGDSSIGLFGFYKILVCQNGLISNKYCETVRVMHKASKTMSREEQISEMLRKVGHATRKVLVKLPEYQRVIESMEATPLEKSIMLAWLKTYTKKMPMAVYSALKDRISVESETVFGLSQALTYVATHKVKNPSWKIKLMKLGSKVLENPEWVYEVVKRHEK